MAVLAPLGRVCLPHEVPETPRDRPSVVELERLQDVLVVAEDAVCACIDPRLGLATLEGSRPGRALFTPMGGHQHEIGRLLWLR